MGTLSCSPLVCAQLPSVPSLQTLDVRWVDEAIQTCHRCLRSKAPHLPEKASLCHLTSSQPMELVCIDYLGLEESKGRYDNILVITDHFTKYAQAIPTRNQTAKTTAKVLFEHYGFPQRIHSDQGHNFEGKLIRELCQLCGIQKSRTTPYHPMGNGLTERFNRTLLTMLRTLEHAKKLGWKSSVSSLVHTHNCTNHDSTGFSPYEIMFGRKPKLPIYILFDLHSNEEPAQYTLFVQKLKDRLKYTYDLVSAGIAKSAKKQQNLL